MDLVQRALAGERRALGRLLTLVENRSDTGRQALKALYSHTGRAAIIGVTGPPGSGKSTLVNQIAKEERRRGKTVAIVAVDPTSPISGGAVLGDRVRMQDLWNDSGIFVRSMASRQALGGLAEATGDVVAVLDAVGFNVVIVETVGVGQAEVDIVREAHATIVVLIPGMGDEIQAMKAGLMEVADLFVVNKADRDGADSVVSQIRHMLSLAPPPEPPLRRPEILKTVATENTGTSELVDAIDQHLGLIRSTGRLAQLEATRARRQVIALVREALLARIVVRIEQNPEMQELLGEVQARRLDPYSAAEAILTGVAVSE